MDNLGVMLKYLVAVVSGLLVCSSARAGIEVKAVALADQAAPGITGAVFGLVANVGVDNRGDILFRSMLEGPGIGWFNDEAIWLRRGNEYLLLARELDPVPLMPGVRYGPMLDAMMGKGGDVQ